MDMNETATIKLDFPFEVNGKMVSELTMRRPKVRDSVAAKKHKGDDGDRGMFMMARLCDVGVDDLMGIDISDLDKLEEQFNSFRGATAQP